MGEKIRFYPIDITYRIKENKAEIYIFGRTVDGKQICVIDEKFEPYFYVLLNDMEDYDNFSRKTLNLQIEDNKRIAFAVRTEIVEKKLIGTPTKLVKVFANIPADVPILRKEINGFKEVKAIYEYDIPFTKKYLIDNNITPLTVTEAHGKYSQENLKVQALKVDKIIPVSDDSLPKLNVLAFDIETYSKTKEIDMEKNPILMISFYGENFKKVYTWKKFKTSEQYIEFVDGEADLILKFKEIIDHHRPDVIAGYFSDGFDFPYIIARAQHYGIDLDIGMDHGKLTHKKGRTDTITIPGILHFDILRFIKMNFGRTMNTESYTLEAVSRELLGEGKQGVDVGNLHHAWDHEPEKLEEFCKYNLQDSYLVYRLFEKLWPNVLEFVKIISQSPLDITQMTFSQLVESYIMKKAQMFNEVSLNRPHYNEENERRMTRYEGAFVFEPKPGLYSDIVVFDFRSLYPSIISSHNICISTLRTSDAKSNPDCAVVPDKNYGFLKKPKGFLPTILEELISRRARVKEILKANKDPLLEARSNSLKLLANSFYGYLGFSGARWYCLECATAVTAYGRYYITKVIEEAKQKGFEVIYSDTDSIFMTLGEKKLEDAKRFVEDVNEKLPGMMELEYESHYPYGIFVSTKSNTGGAKKRYALIDDSGKLKIRGFEMVRSNWSEIGKDVQETTLSIILRENNPEKALKYVKQVIADVRDKKIPNEKVIIKTQITKQLDEYTAVGPNVAAARRMIERGDNVRPGSTVKFIITPGKGALRDKVKLPDEVKEGEYDSDYYIDNQIIPTVDKIFEVLGYNIEELTAKHNQKNLSSFFK